MRPVLPSPDDKARYVQEMFNTIASAYDATNDYMTAGQHRLWKRRLLDVVQPRQGDRLLDLATGTGDIALLAKTRMGPDAGVFGLDFSEEMLRVARVRDAQDAVTWVQGDMLQLPFSDDHFDVVTVGFGLRNVADLEQAIREIHRVLKPGGRFASLEMGHPRQRVLRPFIKGYNTWIMPLIGRLTTGQSTPYRYLQQSSEAFLSQDALAHRLEKHGFHRADVQDLAFGTLAIVSATKPLSN